VYGMKIENRTEEEMRGTEFQGSDAESWCGPGRSQEVAMGSLSPILLRKIIKRKGTKSKKRERRKKEKKEKEKRVSE